MIWCTGLAPWEFEFSFPGSGAQQLLGVAVLPVADSRVAAGGARLARVALLANPRRSDLAPRRGGAVHDHVFGLRRRAARRDQAAHPPYGRRTHRHNEQATPNPQPPTPQPPNPQPNPHRDNTHVVSARPGSAKHQAAGMWGIAAVNHLWSAPCSQSPRKKISALHPEPYTTNTDLQHLNHESGNPDFL